MDNLDMTSDEIKKKIIQQRLRKTLERQKPLSGPDSFPRADRSRPLPLSWAQQRLWLLDRIDPEAGATYHIRIGLRLSGTLDREALQSALDRVLDRHQSLRTIFVDGEHGAVQSITPAGAGFALRHADLRDLSPEAREVEAERLGREEVGAGFDLACGPLIRGLLVRLSEDDHLLLITQHHIVSDGWSSNVLIEELGRTYAAIVAGGDDPLPALPLQYADYAQWQRDWFSGERLQQQLDYWRDVLADAPALLELPTDRPRPMRIAYAGDAVDIRLDGALVAALKSLGSRAGTTLYMTLLAGWAALLGRLCDQDDVVIGSPVAGRARPELESLIGFFVNTLALRIDLSEDPSTDALLARARKRVLDAQSHQDVPFDQVVEAVKPARSTSHAPIFQVALAWQNQGEGAIAMPGLEVADATPPAATTQFELLLDLRERDGELVGTLNYMTALFDRRTAMRIAIYWERLLRGMVADPARAISDLPLLDDEEWTQVVRDWNRTDRAYPDDRCVHALFERQVERTPDAIALVEGDTRMTYADLNRAANRYAHRLIETGVNADDRVAVCMERSTDMIVSLLAVLKAGAGYVPIDPGYPHDRLAFLLDDCAPVALVIGRTSAGAPWATEAQCPVLVFEDAAGHENDRNPAPDGLTARSLACMIYTSGSTGNPKGALVEHRSVVNLVIDNNYADVTDRDCVAHMANPAFDASTWEIWSSLLNGARLLIVPQRTLLDVQALARTMIDGGVSVTFMTVGLLNEYHEALAPAFAGLDALLTGGDVLDPRKIDSILRNPLRPRRVVSCYGPTEATTYVTTHEIVEVAAGRSIPIGRPIANAMCYILDRWSNPVPVGVVGEIWIGGDGVARGYHRRPELTGERFADDPFAVTPGARMYRTGDLGRWLPDGSIEFIGRNDYQVKIRGFRIELGEIEAQLIACGGVRDAIVLARSDAPGEKRLVAYCLSDAALDVAAIRASLSGCLPEYMLPSAFVRLEAWPLTKSGKLDRRALPAPEDDAYARQEYVAPDGLLEQTIAEIWSELLKVERVGRHDNFFELGGHSLIAVMMVERMRRRNIRADVRSLFTASTLAGFAETLNGSERGMQAPPNAIPPAATRIEPAMLPLVALMQAEIDTIVAGVEGDAANIQDIYPLSPLQEGILFHRLLEQKGDFYQVRLMMNFESREQLDAFASSLQQVVDRHDILRTCFAWDGLSQPVQIVQRNATFEHEALIPDPAGGTIEHQLAARFDSSVYRMDIGRAPLFRGCHAHDPQDGRWRMCFVFHHLVMDHASLEIIIEEAMAIARGNGAELPKPAPFRNYIWQARLQSDGTAHEAFFREMLADIDEPSVPFGLSGTNDIDVTIDEARQLLPASLSAAIRRCARELGVSTAAIMHLAWALVLSRAAGTDRVVFGTVLFGRMDSGEGSDRALGLFINTLPLRFDVGEAGAADAVRGAHRSLAELLRHEHASLALAQRQSGLPASMPLFSALINYRHSATSLFMDEGFSIGTVEGGERTTYPLVLSIDDFGDDFGLVVHVAHGVGAERICDFVRAALENLVAALQRGGSASLADIDVLPAAERTRLLRDWNRTDREFPADLCAHQLFERHARLAPASVALDGDDGAVSYATLNAQANRLAHDLRRRGVGPGDRVAICCGRGAPLVTAVLATVKAGAAYVPMDPAYPADRLQYQLSDARPALLLLDATGRDALGAMLGADAPEVLDLVVQAESLHAPIDDIDPQTIGLTSEHPAYVIYTSGSTGLPKAALVPHRGLVNLIDAQAGWLPPGQDTRLLQFASFAFDACVWEIFSSLAIGSTLVLPASSRGGLEGGLMTHLQRHRVSHAIFPPALMNSLSLDDMPACLGTVVLGGEAPSASLIEALRARHRVINAYGPTEASVCSTMYEYADGDHPRRIGRPSANIRAYVLDARGRPAPIGVAGELYIGGAGVGLGYLERPELTAQRFLQDPFEGTPGARMYRTGDLVRWSLDGHLEYIGRNDFQVKLRGFRIELGEIEAQIASAGVRETIVLAREDTPGEKRLVAYCLADDTLDIQALRGELSKRLPDYMVPSAFVRLEAWPLTPNGKLDRKSLPAPDGDDFERVEYQPPQGEIEIALAAIWSDVLKVGPIGRQDHFFRLGGHSLLAVQMVSRVRGVLGTELPLRAMFETPTLARLAERLRFADASEVSPILPTPRGHDMPLSLAQQRLWFMAQIDEAGAAYHSGCTLHIEGALDVEALSRALQRVVDRHETLRTRFLLIEGRPMQRILDRVEIALQCLDIGDDAQADARETLASSRATAFFAAPFDLEHGVPFRAQLLRLEPQRYLLSLVMHHIVSDGWSLGVMRDEIATLYAAYAAGADDPLPPLAIQYVDFAEWQRQWLSGARMDRQTAYWRDALAGAPTLLELPTDRARPLHQVFEGETLDLCLDAALTSRLKALGERHGLTLYMTLLASWAAVLGRLSNQEEVVIGSPVAGRNRSEVESLIGFFVNTLAIRLDLGGSPTVSELLKRTRRQVLDAQAHQDLPFDQVVEAVKPPRSTSHSPIFQTMLAWQNQGGGATPMPGLSVRDATPAAKSAQFELSLHLAESGEEVLGQLNYMTALFDRDTVERYASCWLRVLQAMCDSADAPVAQLPLLEPAERRRIIETWNATAFDHPHNLCMHELIEAQVSRTPEALAVVAGEARWTYAELNARANRLAHHLRALGVGPDERVGICARREAELLLALLAVLKAGGAYVPLDPSYPADRLGYILDDAMPRVVLTDARSAESLSAALSQASHSQSPAVLDLRADAGLWEQSSPENPSRSEVGLSPEHLGYLIYTSGSTGRPKGVAIEHRNAVNFVSWALAAFESEVLGNVLFSTSINFDLSIFEYCVPLSGGGTVTLVENALVLLESPLPVTLINTVPSVMAELTKSEAVPPSVRVVNVAGEPLKCALGERILGSANVERLCNLYGPSETTTYSTWARMDRESGYVGDIGRPVGNTQVYLLDGHGEPVPVGVAGEIWIGGAGVARGYLGQPALTAERFVRDPFSSTPDARMYRTGDLGRWTRDGRIELLGRNDFQVKIRGFRIELGEIESRLTRCEGVREAVVVAREESSGERRLVAYCLTEAPLEVAELRSSLSRHLPEYMIPSAFVCLDSWPLTPNGKLDRKALPAPEEDAYARGTYEAPQGDLETTLAAIWSDLLKIERVGRHDNFFELGGHSLIAVGMIDRLRRQGLGADVRALFGASDLAGFARTLRDARRVEGAPPNAIPDGAARITPDMLPLVALTQDEIDAIAARIEGGIANIRDIYPLSSLQEGILFHRMLETQGDIYQLSTLLHFEDRERLDGFIAAIRQVIDRHDTLRTSVLYDGVSEPVQVVQRRAEFVCEAFVADPSAGSLRDQLAAHYHALRFRMDIGCAPLFRCAHAQDPETGAWLACVVFHHLVMDHTSLDTVIRESTLIRQGRSSELPVPAPFRNYIWKARLQVDQADHDAFFKAMLGDVDEPTSPFGLVEMNNGGAGFVEAGRALSQAMSSELRRHARELGVSAAALFHLAWAIVLARATGMERVVFGTVLFGRMDGGEYSDRALGLFINTLPLRVDLGDLSAADAVRRAHASLAGLLNHEHASLAMAQRQSALGMSTPLFTSLLNYRHSGVETAPSDDDLAIERIGGGERTNYPLTAVVDDLGSDFLIGVQTMPGVGAERVCDFLETALGALVRALAAGPETPLSSVEAMPERERMLVLHEWNETRRAFPLEQCIHALFEATARQRGDATALVFGDARISYAELDARANRFAHWLRNAGIGPGALIAVALERGIDMIATLLGVLKAGAAYLPMALDAPAERVAFMVADSGAQLVLANRSAGMSVELPVPLAYLEDIRDAVAAQSADAPDDAGMSSNLLAYVIYTSGTTGTPKGVAVSHRNVVNFVGWCRDEDLVGPGDATTQFAPYTFDASVGEIFITLISGAELHVLEDATIQNPSHLQQYLLDHDIRFSGFPPSYLQHMDPARVPAGFKLLTAGSAPTPELVQRWTARGHYLNAYGPTETTILSTATWLSADTQTITIGRPIANTSVYLLDQKQRPVPVGVPGEIWIGGEGVTPGYLNRPELTEERYRKDPFADEEGARMYRTGDLGRWLPDGNIEFLGRNDFQVKIRGFRIELGEIESRMCAFADIREALMTAIDDDRGEKRLVAYYLAADAHDAPTLRAHLTQSLPDYMIPAAFVHMDAWPLTANGKIDRKALPLPDDDAYARRVYEPPQTPSEEALASIWAELLKIERVGRHDHFFELGGHSLLAVRLASRVRSAFGIELPLRALFEAPTLAELAERLDAGDVSELSAIPRVARDANLPLSLAQQRLWFLTRIDGASAAYHSGGALRLDGELDVDALRWALQRIVDRHESLRTQFAIVDGQPVQRIVAGAAIEPEMRDLRAVRDPEADASALGASFFERPFDLVDGLPLRVMLLRLGEHRHHISLVMHHIVSDGWSMTVMFQELTRLYAARLAGEEDPLPPLVIQYGDYAQWQRQWLAEGQLERQIDYWRGALAGASTLLELPTDRPRPLHQDYAGAAVDVHVDADLAERLKALSQRHGVTLYMTLLASWAAVLGRLSNQEEVVIGSPVAGRNRSEVESLIGFFVNTLAIRLDLGGSPTVSELLKRTRRQVLDTQAHQDLPFDQVVEAVKPPRSTSHSPIFQVMLALQNQAAVELQMEGLAISPVARPSVTAAFDLVLDLTETDDGIVGGLNYATALFDRETVERYLGYWVRWLRAAVGADEREIARLPILDDDERMRILRTWNETDRPYPLSLCVHQLFERQAETAPDAIALIHGDASFAYADINLRANRLAHHLRSLGVGPDRRVAICCDRGIDMVVSLLAVLKAGAAYVPLDPSYPQERLAHQIADAGAGLLLADASGRAALAAPVAKMPVDARPAVLALDTDAAAWADAPATNPDPARIGLSADSIAYVIYTSGSTGLPKGALLAHRGATNLACAERDLLGIDASSRVLQFASFAFDACVWEMMGAWCAGAALVMPAAGVRLFDGGLIPLLADAGITHATLPPALLNTIELEALPATLGTIVLAGEAPDGGMIERLLARHRVVNAYGPTETTVCATLTYCTSGCNPRVIGTPLPNMRIYVLDASGEPVPSAVAGEIWIGGVGVARGYLDRAELTADRFRDNPFDASHGGRMYRTGDLGRWRSDGDLEFIGRNDFQVKIRGFRVELGEIESQLTADGSIREAVVMAREDGGHGKRLIAYCLSEQPLDTAELRERLGRRLPEYMVPSAFVRLDAWPLTPNGKVDRRALPAPDGEAYARREYEAPQGDIEPVLATLWAELLRVDRVGRHDHFFDLGGHSLLAVQLASRVRGALGIELPLRTIFEAPTLAGLAERLAVAEGGSPDAIVPVPRQGPLPLSLAQERLWFLAQIDGASAAYHMGGALRLSGALDIAAFEIALQRIVDRHETLRTRFVLVDGQPMQAIADSAKPDLRIHDLRGRQDRERASRALGESIFAEPFDLLARPPLRVQLVRVEDTVADLHLVMHHIASDGWSLKVLLDELSRSYAVETTGDVDPLPPLPIQYVDYAQWQRDRLEGGQLAGQTAYWRHELADAPALLTLPTDRPRPAMQDFAGGMLKIDLDETLTARLRALGQRHGTTLYMTLLAGWAVLMGRLAGQQDVVIGSPMSGRNRAEIESLIGFFVNTLALRIDLGDEPDVAELLTRVRRQVLDAQANQDLPFDQVVEAVRPVRTTAHTPIFQTMLTLNNRQSGGFAMPGLAVEPIEADAAPAKFDLSIDLHEGETSIVGIVSYASALFDRATAERYAGYWLRLLQAMTEAGEMAVGRLPILDDAEREQVLRAWNGVARDYPRGLCAHRLFERQAERTPDAVALAFGVQRASYVELNRLANRLAHRLIESGVRPDDRVAVHMERGIELVVAILGVLKAGAAYVPIDPAIPQARRDYILRDAAPGLLLTHGPVRERYAASPIAELCLDRDAAEWGAPRTDNPDPVALGLTDTNLAYVIYTSGSTGQPKGVMVEHGQFANYLFWACEAYAAGRPLDSVVSSPIAFDATVTSLYVPLLTGGSARLLQEGDELSGLETAVSGSTGYELIKITPAHLTALGQRLSLQGACLSAKLFVVGGEALPGSTVAQWKALCPQARIVNEYGPTETVVGCVVHEAGPDDIVTVPIGRPIANMAIRILDADMQPVPIGVEGEIWIGGAQVSRGYHERPELTAERFVMDPFADATGALMYRSGDLGRWRPDGKIEYLGRNDFQVKIRGYRIELGEIEARLLEFAGIREAVVLARADVAGDKRLVGYCLMDGALDIAGIRGRLSAELPPYMVPSAFVRVDAWPLTANGKLDRDALPRPEGDAYARDAYEAPKGPMERMIATVWQELLGVEKVGRHDNFFELGGHSILILRMLKQLGDNGIVLAIQDIYRFGTVAMIAASVRDSTLAPEAWLERDRWTHAVDAAGEARTLWLAAADATPDRVRAFRKVLAMSMQTQRPKRILVVEDPAAARTGASSAPERGAGTGPRDLAEALASLAEALRRRERALHSVGVVDRYGFSTIQKRYARWPYRDALHVTPTPGWWQVDELRSAFAELVRGQEMLRAQMEPGAETWRILDPDAFAAEGDIPHLDLRDLPPDRIEAALSSVSTVLAEAKAQSRLCYAPAIVSWSDTDHAVLLYGDHLIWDHMSFDAIAERMVASMLGEAVPAAAGYRQFVDLARRGHDADVLDAVAADIDAPALAAAMRATRMALQLRETMPIQVLAAILPVRRENAAAEQAFIWFKRMVAALTGMERFGMVMTHHGRQIAGATFFDDVGLFLDKIPAIVDADTALESALVGTQALQRHGISFVEWHAMGDRRVAETLPPPEDEVFFNFRPAAAGVSFDAHTIDIDALRRGMQGVRGLVFEADANAEMMKISFVYRGSNDEVSEVKSMIERASGTVLEYESPGSQPEKGANAEKTLAKPGEVAIVVDGLYKRYGQTDVVSNVSFQVPKGCCFGILGPNGAGKTSLLGMIEGILPITAGRISVMGMDIATEIRKIQPKFGVQLQHSDYFQFLSVSELIQFYAELRAATSGKRRLQPSEKLLQRLDLTDKMSFKVDQLSGGQKQRLSIVLALLADPEIIFLDEPTAALDPHSRRYTWEFIEELKQDRSRTIVMTTHYMEEAERLCDELIIMNKGEIVGRGDPASLVSELSARQQVKIKLGIDSPGERIAQAMGQQIEVVWDMFSDTLVIGTEDVAVAVRDAIRTAEEHGAKILDIQVVRLSLEDVFLNKTGKELKP